MNLIRKMATVAVASVAFAIGMTISESRGAIVTTGFFSGTVELFDESTGAQTTFATIASATDPFPGLSGIAHDSANNRLYVSARISNRLYSVNATTGSVLGFKQLDVTSAPAGVAVDRDGNVYVSNNGGNTISVYDANGNDVTTIPLPLTALGNNLPNGLAFDSQQRLLISTFAGLGVFQYDPSTNAVTPVASNPLANGQVAIDAQDQIYVGGAAFSSAVLKFASDGTPIGSPFLTIDSTLLPQPALDYASPDFTSPTGVTVDLDGNVIVAALGRTNPTSAADNFQSNGGLWKFAPDGTLLKVFGTNLTPLSSVAILPTAVPEPSTLALLGLGGVGWSIRRLRRRSSQTSPS